LKKPYNVAVLLAAQNGSCWIEQQIFTILNQQEINVKIFISVDISNDGTYELCKKIESLNSKIAVLPYGDYFGTPAKNFFRLIKDVEFDNFDFISFSDQDDIWNPFKIIYAIKQIEKNKSDAFSSDVIIFENNKISKLIKKSYPQKKFDYLFEGPGPGCTYLVCSKAFLCFKIFLLENWDAVNQIILHDWLIYAFLRNRNFKWEIDPTPLMLYRQHHNNFLGTNYTVKGIKKRTILIFKGWYLKEIKKINSILKTGINLNKFFIFKNFLQLRRNTFEAIILLACALFGIIN